MDFCFSFSTNSDTFSSRTKRYTYPHSEAISTELGWFDVFKNSCNNHDESDDNFDIVNVMWNVSRLGNCTRSLSKTGNVNR